MTEPVLHCPSLHIESKPLLFHVTLKYGMAFFLNFAEVVLAAFALLSEEGLNFDVPQFSK